MNQNVLDSTTFFEELSRIGVDGLEDSEKMIHEFLHLVRISFYLCSLKTDDNYSDDILNLKPTNKIADSKRGNQLGLHGPEDREL